MRDVLTELGIEKSMARLEEMAKPRGFSWRRMTFVVADESPTRLPGHWRQRPQDYTYPPSGLPLTFGHTHLLIGVCQQVWLGQPNEITGVEGACLVGDALLYDSDLADAAWRGIAQGLFTGVCPVAIRPTTDPPGAGQIMAIGLSEDPWCPNAKIVRVWDWRAEILEREHRNDERTS